MAGLILGTHTSSLNLTMYSKLSVQTIGTVFVFKRKKIESKKYVEIINGYTII